MNILITGASSGIGFEAALEWIRDSNHTVVAIARNIDKLKRLHQIAKDLNPECNLIPVQFDIVSGDYKHGLLPFLQLKLSGKIDVLVNNAGELFFILIVLVSIITLFLLVYLVLKQDEVESYINRRSR